METRHISRSVDHVNWWEPEHWKPRAPRSVSSVSLEGADPAEIRNGWLTLPSAKVRYAEVDVLFVLSNLDFVSCKFVINI